jgi:hypothetical protein
MFELREQLASGLQKKNAVLRHFGRQPLGLPRPDARIASAQTSHGVESQHDTTTPNI